MKQKFRNSFLRASIAVATLAIATSAHAADLTWSTALPGNWNTSNTNWTGSTWNNATPDNAIFNNLNGTVTLSEAISADSLTYNNGGAPSGGHELILTGSNLSVGSVLSWGGYNAAGGGGGVDNIDQAYGQRLRIDNMTLNVSGDATVKRGMLYFNAANVNVGGTIKSTDAWNVFRADNSTVTATGGIDLSVIASQVELYGGTVTTPFIKVGNAAFNGTGGLTMGNGVTVVASQNESDFIQVYNDGNTNSRAAATLISGGITLDTSSYAVTVATQLNGGGSVTKSGAGTLTLNQSNSFTGGTTVNQGMLVLAGSAWTLNNIGGGSVSVGSGATLRADNSVANQINGLTLNGGTVDAVNSTGNGDWGNFFLTGNVTATGTSALNAQTALRASNVNFDVASGDTLNVGGVLFGGYQFTNAGISKSGAGTLALTATNTYIGNTTVDAGTLRLGNGTSNSNLSDGATVSIANGASVNLNFTGSDIVGKLIIDGNTMSGGIYNATTHPTYFTGNGSLTVLEQDGIWTSIASGNWSTSSNWDSNVIATGSDKTATFSVGTGSEAITVTLDTPREISKLAFSNANYTLAGGNTLTLVSTTTTTPLISVATGLTATVSTNLGGTVGLEKNGAGTLSLYAGAGDNWAKTYNQNVSGGLTIKEGTVELASQYIRMGSITIGNGATLKCTQPWATGYSSTWLDGASAGSITVEAGGTLTTTTHANALIEGLTLKGGSVTAPGVTDGDWGAFVIASTVTADGATSSISAELAVTGNQSFYVLAGSTLDVSGVVHNRAGTAGAITKEGEGILTLGGTNTYSGNTVVNDGALNVTSGGSLRFYPGANGSTNSVSAGSSTATLSFLGTVNLDLSTANTTNGNLWPLFNLTSFTGSKPVLTPTAVTSSLGSFTEASSGTWELSVTGAKWVFTESNGQLAYVVTATPYETWCSTYGLTAGSESGDLDNDGLSNFEEFAFGLLPNNGSSSNPITTQLNKTTGQFTYQRLNGSGLTYTIWTSSDLVTWTEDVTAGANQNVTTGTPNDSVVVTLTNSLLTNPKLFVRVQAQ